MWAHFDGANGTYMFRRIGSLLLLIFSSLAAAQIAPAPAVQVASSPFRTALAQAPQPQRSPFRTLSILSTTAWAADMATTQAGILSGASEMNPIFGRHPSPARLWGTSSALQGAFLYGCYLEQRQHPQGRFWKTMMKVSTALHAGATANNLVVMGRISR